MVTKQLTSNFKSIMQVKMYFFLKKSILRYLIITFLFGFLKPIGELGGFYSFLVYFSGIMFILFPLQIFSAKIMAKKINFDADVEFNDAEIIVRHRNKDKTEHKDWSWVKEIDFRKNIIYLVLNERFPFGIGLYREKLTDDDIAFFERKKHQKENSH